MKARWILALSASLLSQFPGDILAFETFTIQDVRVEGLQRIAEGTVYNYLPVSVGDTLSESQSYTVIKSLFDTGFFHDIRLSKDGDTLVISVIERPTIGKITVEGNKDIPTDKLVTSLKDAGLAEGYVFDRSTLELMRNQLEHFYNSSGKYAVKITSKVEEKENNRVNISIHIVEGVAARIKSIEFTGNHVFTDNELLKRFTISEAGYTTWVTRTDQYDKQKLAADLETLRTFYLDRGYLNFKILSTQVSISPEKRDIFIHVNVEEGQRYTLSGYKLSGDYPVADKEFEEFIDLQSGEVFSRTKIADIVKAMQDKLGEHGFAFAKVNPAPELNEDNNTVFINFFIEAGYRNHVRRVVFEGNTKTKDEVLRREVIQLESAPVNTLLIEDSKTRLNRTGYFSDVKVETRPVPGTTDLVDVVYIVEEANAGQISGGLGYSNVDGLIYNASVSNRNFLGSGNSLDFNFNRSKAYTTYNVSYNNPYYTMDGVSRGMNLYYSKTDLSESTDITSYTTDARGANMNFGYPVSPYDRVSFGFGFQSTKLAFKNSAVPPSEIQDFLFDREGYRDARSSKSNEVSLALGWSHNSFDRYLFPQNGTQQGASVSATFPGSDLQYYILSYNLQWYKYIARDYIFKFSTTIGYGDGYGKTEALPFYRNFYAGGHKTVRGYEEHSLGPLDSLNNPFGGNALVAASIGLVIPNPFGVDPKVVRTSIFIDAGQVYDVRYKRHDRTVPGGIPGADPITLLDTSRHPDNHPRYSMGASITWMTPMAPLSFSYAVPLNAENTDKQKRFNFSFGTTF